MLRTDLRTGWTVRAVGSDPAGRVPEIYPAEVPGCVHTDLMAAGVIPDPYLDGNEAALRWMYGVDWRYVTVLDADVLDLQLPRPHEQVDLVFDGIDTVGTVRLRKTELGRTYNMHRSYRFDISSYLGDGPLELEVDLRSATAYAEAERERLGDRPSAYPAPYNFIRKMACSFGWDWGPDLRTAGLWKPVRLERWSLARIAQVVPLVTLDDGGNGRVELRIELERLDSEAPLTLTAEILGHRVSSAVDHDRVAATLIIDVPEAPAWWPVGHGEQPLAELTLVLSTDDLELDRWQRKLGFRSVELDTSADHIGTAFTISVNRRPVFVKGVNWIPDDHFLTRITAERIERRLDQAVAANVNLIRVWGGGIYESEEFYRACDERGILVWQDFLLACAAYPEESPLWEEIEAEARENVVRLAPHPSLVLFNGGNENLWGHEDWNWQESLDGHTWGAGYAHELFPKIVTELDPTRPYSANSPYSPGANGERIHPNDPDHGTHHQWEVWNRIDYTAYRREIPRFCSEFGFQAPPAWRTLSDWVHAVDGSPLESASDPKNDAISFSTKRPMTATASSTVAWPRTLECQTTSRTGTGLRSSIRPGRSRTRSTTTDDGGHEQQVRSSGSLMTAGRSPPGPRSTSRSGPSPCGTRCDGRLRPGTWSSLTRTASFRRWCSTTPTSCGTANSCSAGNASTVSRSRPIGSRSASSRGPPC